MPLTEQVVVHDPVASGGRGWFHIKPGEKEDEMDDRVGHSRFGILLQKIIRGI